jgi:CBS domain-containing protein
MINPFFDQFLQGHISTLVKPASTLAVVMSDHMIAHAKLLLSTSRYTRVPVLNHAKEFVGIIGLAEIQAFELANPEYDELEQTTPIHDIMTTDILEVQTAFTIEEVMSNLVREPFLPVLRGREFVGIITRQEALKAINALLHDFGKYYDISERNPEIS